MDRAILVVTVKLDLLEGRGRREVELSGEWTLGGWRSLVGRVADLKSAYKQLVKHVHPDKSDHPNAHEAFQSLTEHKNFLMRCKTKQLYPIHIHTIVQLQPLLLVAAEGQPRELKGY